MKMGSKYKDETQFWKENLLDMMKHLLSFELNPTL